MLPSGRLRLATTPALIGSEPMTKTIGMVVVAALAASAGGMPPAVAMTETLRPTRSAASAGSRSYCPSAPRYSNATFPPSMNPFSLTPRRKPATPSPNALGDAELRSPTTGIAGCSANALSGQTTAAPPSADMNSRLAILIAIGPSIGGHAHWIIANIAPLNTEVFDVLRNGSGGQKGRCFSAVRRTCSARFVRWGEAAISSDPRQSGHQADVTRRHSFTPKSDIRPAIFL